MIPVEPKFSNRAALATIIPPFLLAFLLILLPAGYLFFELAGEVWLQEGFVWDPSMMLLIEPFRTPLLTFLLECITLTAGPYVVLPVAAVAIFFRRRNEGLLSAIVVAGVSIAALTNVLIKNLFQRARPNIIPLLVVEKTYSFPSGHTLTAAIFYGFLATELWQRGHRRAALASITWIFLVGFSRVYLGVHYPSDVLASMTLGSIWVVLMRAILSLSYRFFNMSP